MWSSKKFQDPEAFFVATKIILSGEVIILLQKDCHKICDHENKFYVSDRSRFLWPLNIYSVLKTSFCSRKTATKCLIIKKNPRPGGFFVATKIIPSVEGIILLQKDCHKMCDHQKISVLDWRRFFGPPERIRFFGHQNFTKCWKNNFPQERLPQYVWS